MNEWTSERTNKQKANAQVSEQAACKPNKKPTGTNRQSLSRSIKKQWANKQAKPPNKQLYKRKAHDTSKYLSKPGSQQT